MSVSVMKAMSIFSSFNNSINSCSLVISPLRMFQVKHFRTFELLYEITGHSFTFSFTDLAFLLSMGIEIGTTGFGIDFPTELEFGYLEGPPSGRGRLA